MISLDLYIIFILNSIDYMAGRTVLLSFLPFLFFRPFDNKFQLLSTKKIINSRKSGDFVTKIICLSFNLNLILYTYSRLNIIDLNFKPIDMKRENYSESIV